MGLIWNMGLNSETAVAISLSNYSKSTIFTCQIFTVPGMHIITSLYCYLMELDFFVHLTLSYKESKEGPVSYCENHHKLNTNNIFLYLDRKCNLVAHNIVFAFFNLKITLLQY